MASRPDPIRSIAVLGGGVVGLSAALAFARGLPGVTVTLARTPPDPAALADRLSATLPDVHAFHALIGLEERELVREGAATPRLGVRFADWSATGEPWLRLFAEHGARIGNAGFEHHWARAAERGRARPWHRHAAAGALAEAGRFVHPAARAGTPLATFDYTLRLDPDRYAARLARELAHLPVRIVEGAFAEAERRADGGVAALRLQGGERIEADLFLDCSGPAAPLLRAIEDRFESWAEALPCDRLLIAAAGGDEPGPLDEAAAVSIGWRWRAPGAGRASAGLCYASAAAGEARARRVLAAEAGVGEAELVRFSPGRRRDPWVRNVLALGDAAAAPDPAGGLDLALAQSGVRRALALLPGRDCHPIELAEHNRLSRLEAENARDFAVLHYAASGRRQGEFWRAAARIAPPPSLAETIAQFRRRGRLPHREEDLLDRESWIGALIGLGLRPGRNPLVEATPEAESEAAMARIAATLAALPARLPPYRDYLARMKAGQAA